MSYQTFFVNFAEMFPCEISLRRGKFIFSLPRISNPLNKAVRSIARVGARVATFPHLGRFSAPWSNRAEIKACVHARVLVGRERAFIPEKPGTNEWTDEGPGRKGDLWGLWGHVHTKRPLQTPAAVHHPCPTLHARSLFSPAFLARLNLALPPFPTRVRYPPPFPPSSGRSYKNS